MCVCVLFFFFKQKTAYEMRISDWSSDVCSSDLLHLYTVSRKIDWRIAVMIFEHLGGCSGPQEDGGPERGTQRKSSKCLHGPRPLMPFWSIRKRARPCNVTVRADRSALS